MFLLKISLFKIIHVIFFYFVAVIMIDILIECNH